MITRLFYRLRRRFCDWLDRRRVARRGGAYLDFELIYSAFARCRCGAGLAYPRHVGTDGYWDCAAILTGQAIPKGKLGVVQHTAKLPFVFYDVKSERRPSASGQTMRPLCSDQRR